MAAAQAGEEARCLALGGGGGGYGACLWTGGSGLRCLENTAVNDLLNRLESSIPFSRLQVPCARQPAHGSGGGAQRRG